MAFFLCSFIEEGRKNRSMLLLFLKAAVFGVSQSVMEVTWLIGKIVDRWSRQVRFANIGLRSDLRR